MKKGERGVRVPGPGAIRVGCWVGRLGVVGLSVTAAGLGLDERVVRRHVARLEANGWLQRAPASIRGQGSVIWLTGRGLVGVGLSQLRAVRVAPAPAPAEMVIVHGRAVALSAAWLQRRGRFWLSRRELAVDPGRWQVSARSDRGRQVMLPDLVAWLPPLA